MGFLITGIIATFFMSLIWYFLFSQVIKNDGESEKTGRGLKLIMLVIFTILILQLFSIVMLYIF